MRTIRRAGKRVLVQIAGWILVLAGLAGLVLPGPGLLLLLGGMAVLATQYRWAERHMEHVEKAAHRAAEESVETGPRIGLSLASVVALIGVGVCWCIGPDAPAWWPVADTWWLFGGWVTGASLIGSGLIGLGLLIYSYLRFRRGFGRPLYRRP